MRLFVPVLGLALWSAVAARAEPAPVAAAPAEAPAEDTELTGRLSALERIEPLDDSVQRPVDVAKAALERARASHARSDEKAALRAERLARAAVELAEARLRLWRERSLHNAVQARAQAAERERAQAATALEHERARAQALQRAGSTP